MKVLKLVLSLILLLPFIQRVNAQEVVFDLTLNRQDSTIAYRVSNHTGVKLMVARSIMKQDNIMNGSYCRIKYRNTKGNVCDAFLVVAAKHFILNPEETHCSEVDISQYMKCNIIEIEGILSVGYHLLGEFNMRIEKKRRVIKF